MEKGETLHAEMGALVQLKTPEQRAARKEEEAVAMVVAALLGKASPTQETQLLISKVMESADPPFAPGRGRAIEMMLAYHCEPGMLEGVCRVIAAQVGAMPPERREAWLGVIGEREEGDEASAQIQRAVRTRLGEFYALRERDRLSEATDAAPAARRPGL